MRADSQPGLPGAVIGVVYAVVLVGSLVVGGGVLMANVMSCDSGGEQCATGMMTATLTWAVITFLLPIGALVWGLVSSRDTRTGRRNRIFALILILVLPIIGLAANLTILFQPVFHE